MRIHILTSLALAAGVLAGCGGGQTGAVPASGNGLTPFNVAFSDDDRAGGFTVGVRLTGENSGKSKPYGAVLGYFKGTTAKTSKVVTIPMGSTVVFTNVDSTLPHTASLLGDASKKSAPWPSSFTGSGTASPAGTDISATNFSTGTLQHGSSSASYTASVPGFYMFGCAFHYVSHEMRDVIIVK
jgi:plastocyanin